MRAERTARSGALEEGSVVKTMTRAFGSKLGSVGGLLPLAVLAGLALATPARALVIENGDLVGVWVKNGFEVVVNLGTPTPGAPLDLTGTIDITEFSGSLVGARFIGLAVEDPGRMVNVPGFGSQAQENVIYTSLVTDPMPSDSEIAAAMGVVDSTGASANVWFNLLRQLPGTDSEVIPSSELFSYEQVLGVGTDAIANRFTFSTAGVYDLDERLEIPVYSAVRGYADLGGPATEYAEILNLAFDGSQVEFQPAPEASGALGTLVGGVVLTALARRRKGGASPR
jgi:hypothetical protein